MKDQVYKLYFTKGHYYSYTGAPLVSSLTYPVPDPHLRSLGLHTTLDLGGSMKLGPDAHYIDENDDYSFPSDDTELKRKFFDTVSRYLPSLQLDKLQRGYVGIRPKLAGPGEPFR